MYNFGANNFYSRVIKAVFIIVRVGIVKEPDEECYFL